MAEHYLTQDQKLIKVGMAYYVLARLADPVEKVTLVGFAGPGRSLLDGQMTSRWLVRSSLGNEYLCEASHLSQVPPDELYRSLRQGAAPQGMPAQPHVD